jgi:hypothetical protein
MTGEPQEGGEVRRLRAARMEAFSDPTAAVFGYLVIALFYIVPFRALRGRRREVGQA